MTYHEVVNGLSHKLRVMRMYRYGMRELLNWSMSRRGMGVFLHTRSVDLSRIETHSLIRSLHRPSNSLNVRGLNLAQASLVPPRRRSACRVRGQQGRGKPYVADIVPMRMEAQRSSGRSS
jgi:hypothetical protein